MKTELILKTEDHPESFGRKAAIDDIEYTLRFPLEDGRELVLKIGNTGFQTLTNMLVDMLANTPSYGDNTTNVG